MVAETAIRLTSFLSIFGIMAYWELKDHARPLKEARKTRWCRNLGITILNSLLLRIVLPVSTIELARWATNQNLGLLGTLSWQNGIAGFLISFLMLDLCIYLQHVVFHRHPQLWRIHRVHHADQDFDVTTGARFHPLEIILSMVIKFSLVLLIGVPPYAILVFEVALNATAMFNHANISLPPSLEVFIRKFLVTPDMHRVHHSQVVEETNSNFGFNLPWWDYIFKTYVAQPHVGQDKINIGIKGAFDKPQAFPLEMIIMPFLPMIKMDQDRLLKPLHRPGNIGLSIFFVSGIYSIWVIYCHWT